MKLIAIFDLKFNVLNIPFKVLEHVWKEDGEEACDLGTPKDPVDSLYVNKGRFNQIKI